MRYGSTPAIPNDTNRPRGSSSSRPAAASLVTSIAAAPSTIALELPAVTLPSSLNAGLSDASFSSDVSRLGFSSTATRTAAPPAPVSTGTISRSKRPSSIAAIARRWDSYEYSSRSSRERPHSSAMTSAEMPCGTTSQCS